MTKIYERSNQMGTSSIADEIPWLFFSGDVLVNRDLSLAAGWSLQLPNTMLADSKSRAACVGMVRSILNSLPDNYDWQFRWVQHNRTEEFADLLDERPKPDGLAGQIVREGEAVLLGLLGTKNIAWKEAQLLIVRRPKAVELVRVGANPSKIKRIAANIKAALNSLWDSSASKEAEIDQQNFIRACNDLEGVLRSLEPMLAGSGLFPKRLKKETFSEVLFHWANKSRFIEGGFPPDVGPGNYSPLPDSLALSDWELVSEFKGSPVPPGVFRMGDTLHTCMTLAVPPDALGLGMWEQVLYGAFTNCEVTTWGTPQDKTKRLSKLRRLLNTLRGSKSDDPSYLRMIEDIEMELKQLGGNEERLWRVFCTFHIWGSSVDEVMNTVSAITVLSEANGRIGMVHEKKNPWAFFRATCPGWTRDTDIYRAIDLTTQQASRVVPLFGQPTFLKNRPDKIGALFSTIASTAGMLNIDPHDTTLYAAPHFIITAGTGAGKSVLASTLMLEMLGVDGRVIMIDRGGSFDGIAAAMGVTPIRLSSKEAASGITLNPLYYGRGRAVLPEQLDMMLSMLEVMIQSAAQEEGRMRGDDKRVLRECLQRLLDENAGEERTLSELKDRLASTIEGRTIAKHLATWCANGGEYSTMFDGHNKLQIEGRLVVIDLGQDSRGNNKALTNVLTMIIINMVSSLLATTTTGRKFLLFDEAGVMMKEEAQAEFIEYAYRTFRKSGISCGAMSQLAMDMEKLFSFSPIKLFLRQDDLEDTREACRVANIPTEVVGFVRDLASRPGEFADFICIQHLRTGQTLAHLCRNYSTPNKYAMITSSKEDTLMIDKIQRERKCGRGEAMLEFAKLYPRGVAASHQ